jgi:ArsR family transcriptional regulator, arsenate/arsenite/antimonite-responsive transcriptional repressor
VAGYAGIFKALGDETRQLILEMLGQREMAAGEIAAAFQMSQPAISHHLAVLRQTGLVLGRRDGQRVIYSLDHSRLSECWSGFFSAFLEKSAVAPAGATVDSRADERKGGEISASTTTRR